MNTSEKIRNFVFGVEDSLVSTVGLVSGIAVAGVPAGTILLTGRVLVLVEAFSMAVGSLISSNAAQEAILHKEIPLGFVWAGAFIMFISYIGSGILIVLPYALFPVTTAFPVSIIIALSALFLLGVISAGFSGTNRIKKGCVVALLGGIAIVLGSAVGIIF